MGKKKDPVKRAKTAPPARLDDDARRLAHDAVRRSQRLASQLHQIISASIAITSLRDEREILAAVAESARDVFDAVASVVTFESPGFALRARAERVGDATTGPLDPSVDELRARPGGGLGPGDWLVAPVLERRDRARRRRGRPARPTGGLQRRGPRDPGPARPARRHRPRRHAAQPHDRIQRDPPAASWSRPPPSASSRSTSPASPGGGTARRAGCSPGPNWPPASTPRRFPPRSTPSSPRCGTKCAPTASRAGASSRTCPSAIGGGTGPSPRPRCPPPAARRPACSR